MAASTTRNVRVAPSHSSLNGERITDCVHDTRKLDQNAIAHRLDDTTAVSGNSGIDLFYDAVAVGNKRIQKQVVATIDHATTDCCLHAHGQIAEMNGFFQLDPSCFNEEMNYPPFHYGCRTSVALYTPEMETDGITTGEMRDAASSEIVARSETGERVRIYPSSATSRR